MDESTMYNVKVVKPDDDDCHMTLFTQQNRALSLFFSSLFWFFIVLVQSHQTH